MDKKEIILEGENIKNIEDFHNQIKEKMKFPDYYEKNLDALLDCLREIETPTTLSWQDFKISKENLGDKVNKILEVFKQAEKEVPEFKLVIC